MVSRFESTDRPVEQVGRDGELIADVIATLGEGDPVEADLVQYARDPRQLSATSRSAVEHYLSESPANRERFRALAPADWTLRGSCLCGHVQYTVPGPLPAIVHCHCRVCRKAHGAAFGSVARIAAADLSWEAGTEQIGSYEVSAEWKRLFCRRCGTSLAAQRQGHMGMVLCGTSMPAVKPGGEVELAVATLDADPATRPAAHTHAAERACWFEFADEMPSHAGALEETET